MSINWFKTLLIRNDSISDTLYTGAHDSPKCKVMENLDLALFSNKPSTGEIPAYEVQRAGGIHSYSMIFH